MGLFVFAKFARSVMRGGLRYLGPLLFLIRSFERRRDNDGSYSI